MGVKYYKASFHVAWPVVLSRSAMIPSVLQAAGVIDKVDTTVYAEGRRLFNIIGSVKKFGDTHFLQPCVSRHHFHDHLITVTAGYPVLDFPLPAPQGPDSLPSAPAAFTVRAAPTDAAAYLMGKPTVLLQHSVRSALISKGMETGYQLGSINYNEMYCTTNPGGRCCLDGKQHDRNNFSVTFRRTGHLYFRCLSSKCPNHTPQLIGTWLDECSMYRKIKERLQPSSSIDIVYLKQLMRFYQGERKAKKLEDVEEVPGWDEVMQHVTWYLNHYMGFVTKDCCYLMYKLDPSGEYLSHEVYSPDQMKQQVKQYMPLFVKWDAHEDKRMYSSVVSDPRVRSISIGSDFNRAAYQSPMFHMEKIDMTEDNMQIIQPILDHIRSILCNNNESDYLYFIKWMAKIARDPAYKSGVAPLFYGPQGTGKGIIFNKLFKSMWGDGHLQITDFKSLTSKFNSLVSSK